MDYELIDFLADRNEASRRLQVLNRCLQNGNVYVRPRTHEAEAAPAAVSTTCRPEMLCSSAWTCLWTCSSGVLMPLEVRCLPARRIAGRCSQLFNL